MNHITCNTLTSLKNIEFEINFVVKITAKHRKIHGGGTNIALEKYN